MVKIHTIQSRNNITIYLFLNNFVKFHCVFFVYYRALDMIPQPVLGVLMLFPIKEASELASKEQAERIKQQGQIISPKVYFMKQTVGNACGTVGLLQTIINAKENLSIQKDSYIEKFLNKTASMTSDERAEYLSNDDEIEATHESAATLGQSEQIHEEVNTHFVCFT